MCLEQEFLFKKEITNYQSFMEVMTSFYMAELPYEFRIKTYINYLLLFSHNIDIGYIVRDLDEAKYIINKLYELFDNLPKILRPQFYKKNEFSCITMNSRNSFQMIYKKSDILGRRYDYIIVDDYETYKCFANELVPSLVPDGKIITRMNFDDVISDREPICNNSCDCPYKKVW